MTLAQGSVSPLRRARDLLRAERAEEALKITTPLATAPDAPFEALTVHAAVLKGLERTLEALPVNRRAVDLAPTNPIAWHNYAATLGDLGRYEEAVEATDQAFRCSGSAPETWLVRARALMGQAKFDDAVVAFHEALERRPAYYDAHRELAQLVWMQTEDVAAATAGIEAAVQAHPGDVGLRLTKAKVLGYAGLHSEAFDAALEAFKKAPGDLGVALATANHARLAGDQTAAAAIAQQAYQMAPNSRGAVEAWCTACLAAGRADLAFQAAQRAVATRPLDQLLLAFLAISARVLGRPEYERLYDYDAFVRPAKIEAPAGWADLPAYLADLKAALVRLHAFKAHPFDQSLRHGSQTTQNLRLSEEPAVKAFFDAVDAPIRAYMAAVGQGPDPLRSRNTGEYAVRGAWSVRLRPDGYHVNHVHPQGWLSSAFYVETPAEALDTGEHQGWIKFGQPELLVKPPLEPARYIRPEPGTLVLFPSYMFHGTVPFSTAESRLTIAFDVVPA